MKFLYNSFDALTVPPGEFIETIKILGFVSPISSNCFLTLEGEIKLNPTEKGEYQIYVTQDSNTTKTVYTVEDENENLEIRLSLLQTLQKILEIIFGK